MKQKIFEKNCRIQFLEKQRLRDKAELDAKDKFIEQEARKYEDLQRKLHEQQEQNRQFEELLQQKVSDL